LTPFIRCARLGAAAVTLAFGGLAALPAGTAAQLAVGRAAATTDPPMSQGCGGASWVAGSVTICDGTLVYRDYVYDDEGADTGKSGYGMSPDTSNAYGTLAPPAGDIRYATAADVNSADLVNLRLSRTATGLHVVAELNALSRPDSTVLAIAVGDARAAIPQPLKPWGVVNTSSAGWDDVYAFSVGDPTTNTITGDLPMPAASSIRVQAVVAKSDKTVMNVAFRGIGEKAEYELKPDTGAPYPYPGQGAWFEDNQAAALRAGDISRFGYTFEKSDLTPGVTRVQPVGPGLHERVYTSAHTIAPGEGMSYAGVPGRGSGGSVSAFSQVFNFLGKYQPYGIYIPAAAGPHGLQMEWHGSNQGIVAQINQPGMQRDFGDGLNRILVVPEARGPNGYGSDISERDLLDVMDDVRAHYPIDPRKVFSSGYSQGGYITFRMAMLYPDRFAGFTGWVAFTGDDLNGTPAGGNPSVRAGAVGNMIDYVRNLRHVPGSMIYAGADELVQLPSSSAMERAFAGTDDLYTWYLHPTAEHLTFAVLDRWAKEAADSRNLSLVTDPARVTFRTAAELDALDLGIRHDSAYWISAIRGAGPGFIDTDLTSYGCGVDVPTTLTGSGSGPDPVPWVSTFRTATGSTHLPAQQKIEGTLVNVASLTIDARRSCLSRGAVYSISSDRAAVVHLSDGSDVSLQPGLNTGVVGQPGRGSAVSLQPGLNTGVVGQPGRGSDGTASSGTSSQAGRSLAATGLPALLPVLAMGGLLGGWLLARARRRAVDR